VGVGGSELTRANPASNPASRRKQYGVPLSPVAELHNAAAETGLQPKVQLLLMLELSLIELDAMNRQRFDSLHEMDEVTGKCEAQQPTPRPDRRALERCSDDIRVREPERDSGSRQRAGLNRCDGRVCRSALGAEQAGDERAQKAEHPKTRACATGVEPYLNTLLQLQPIPIMPERSTLIYRGQFRTEPQPRAGMKLPGFEVRAKAIPSFFCETFTWVGHGARLPLSSKKPGQCRA